MFMSDNPCFFMLEISSFVSVPLKPLYYLSYFSLLNHACFGIRTIPALLLKCKNLNNQIFMPMIFFEYATHTTNREI